MRCVFHNRIAEPEEKRSVSGIGRMSHTQAEKRGATIAQGSPSSASSPSLQVTGSDLMYGRGKNRAFLSQTSPGGCENA